MYDAFVSFETSVASSVAPIRPRSQSFLRQLSRISGREIGGRQTGSRHVEFREWRLLLASWNGASLCDADGCSLAHPFRPLLLSAAFDVYGYRRPRDDPPLTVYVNSWTRVHSG